MIEKILRKLFPRTLSRIERRNELYYNDKFFKQVCDPNLITIYEADDGRYRIKAVKE